MDQSANSKPDISGIVGKLIFCYLTSAAVGILWLLMEVLVSSTNSDWTALVVISGLVVIPLIFAPVNVGYMFLIGQFKFGKIYLQNKWLILLESLLFFMLSGAINKGLHALPANNRFENHAGGLTQPFYLNSTFVTIYVLLILTLVLFILNKALFKEQSNP